MMVQIIRNVQIAIQFLKEPSKFYFKKICSLSLKTFI